MGGGRQLLVPDDTVALYPARNPKRAWSETWVGLVMVVGHDSRGLVLLNLSGCVLLAHGMQGVCSPSRRQEGGSLSLMVKCPSAPWLGQCSRELGQPYLLKV